MGGATTPTPRLVVTTEQGCGGGPEGRAHTGHHPAPPQQRAGAALMPTRTPNSIQAPPNQGYWKGLRLTAYAPFSLSAPRPLSALHGGIQDLQARYL